MVGELINTLDSLDYILLTTKACENRFDLQAEYILNKIQDLFAKDVKDRFVAMCTFSDGKAPHAL